MFIHDAVLESLICVDTQIPASGLVGAIEKLKQRDNETGRTGFETQFHVCHTRLLVHSSTAQRMFMSETHVYVQLSQQVESTATSCIALP